MKEWYSAFEAVWKSTERQWIKEDPQNNVIFTLVNPPEGLPPALLLQHIPKSNALFIPLDPLEPQPNAGEYLKKLMNEVKVYINENDLDEFLASEKDFIDRLQEIFSPAALQWIKDAGSKIVYDLRLLQYLIPTVEEIARKYNREHSQRLSFGQFMKEQYKDIVREILSLWESQEGAETLQQVALNYSKQIVLDPAGHVSLKSQKSKKSEIALDRHSNKIWGKDFTPNLTKDNTVKIITTISNRDKRPAVSSFLNFGNNPEFAKCFASFEAKQAYRAINDLYCYNSNIVFIKGVAGSFRLMTYSQIWRQMGHDRSMTPDQRHWLSKTIKSFQGTIVSLSNAAEFDIRKAESEGRHEAATKLRKICFSDVHLLDCDNCYSDTKDKDYFFIGNMLLDADCFDINGKRPNGFILVSRQPVYYRYAEIINQIVEVPSKVWEAKNKQHNEEFFLLRDTILQRTAHIESGHEKNNKEDIIKMLQGKSQEPHLYDLLGVFDADNAATRRTRLHDTREKVALAVNTFNECGLPGVKKLEFHIEEGGNDWIKVYKK